MTPFPLRRVRCCTNRSACISRGTIRTSWTSTVDLLAYHFDHTENLAKKREYLLKAGEAAQATSANAAAVSYYQRLLPLQPERQQIPVMLRLGQVLELMGEWHDADEIDRRAESLAKQVDDVHGQAQAQQALGWLLRKRGEYSQAEIWLARARDSYQQTDDQAGVSRALADIGEVQRLQGKYAEAKNYYDDSLRLAAGATASNALQAARAHALRGAGTVATWQGDYATARALNQESLALRRELGDTPGVATLLNNLGIIARFQHDLPGARQMNDESLALFRQIGDRWAVGQLLNNQACVASDQGNYAEARALLEESLSIRRQLGDKAGLALSLNTLADVVLDEGRLRLGPSAVGREPGHQPRARRPDGDRISCRGLRGPCRSGGQARTGTATGWVCSSAAREHRRTAPACRAGAGRSHAGPGSPGSGGGRCRRGIGNPVVH